MKSLMFAVMLVLGLVTQGFAAGGSATGVVYDSSIVWTSSNGETEVVNISPFWMNPRIPFMGVQANLKDEAPLPAVSISIGTWAATTTAEVIYFEYGTNVSFRLDTSPDLSPGSWRKIIAGSGEYLGATYSDPASPVKWIKYWVNFGDKRSFRITTNLASPPPT